MYLLSEVGGVVQSGNCFVPCCARERACARFGSPGVQRNRREWLFPFPLGLGILSCFPCEMMCSLSLEINEIKGIQTRSSEIN